MKLYELSAAALELQERLDNIEDEDTRQCIEDTLEALNCSIEDKSENIVKVIKNYEGDVASIDTEIKRLQAMKKAKTNNITGLKEYLKSNLIGLGRDKVETTLFKITVGKGQEKVVIEDETKVPSEFIKTYFEVDKTSLKNVLKDEEKAEEFEKLGIKLDRTPTLLIK